jgi:hypothetical protein
VGAHIFHDLNFTARFTIQKGEILKMPDPVMILVGGLNSVGLKKIQRERHRQDIQVDNTTLCGQKSAGRMSWLNVNSSHPLSRW